MNVKQDRQLAAMLNKLTAALRTYRKSRNADDYAEFRELKREAYATMAGRANSLVIVALVKSGMIEAPDVSFPRKRKVKSGKARAAYWERLIDYANEVSPGGFLKMAGLS